MRTNPFPGKLPISHRALGLSTLSAYLVFNSALAQPDATVDSNTLSAAHEAALDLIASGQPVQAAERLLNAVSWLPKNQPNLLLPATGPMQLLVFTNEYLLTDAEQDTLYTAYIREENNRVQKLLVTQMRYMDETQMSQDEATNCARDLYYLTQCDHLPVRLGALFVMSDPYYFYDTGLGQQARDQIAREFSASYFAQEAQRLALYDIRKRGAAGLLEVLERTNDDGQLRPETKRLRADPVGKVIYAALSRGISDDSQQRCIADLMKLCRTTKEWGIEYAALTVMECFFGSKHAVAVNKVMEDAIKRNLDPRCVHRAWTIRLHIALKNGDAAEAAANAIALLTLEDIPVVPERNNYEELRNLVDDTATLCAKNGDRASAVDVLNRLAMRYPNSALASKLKAQIADVSSSDQSSANSSK